MRKGIMIWKEIMYTEIEGDEQLLSVVKELEAGREESDGAPTVVSPEIDGTFTVSRRFFVRSEWGDDSKFE
jgi:hypothetical protein